MVGIHASCVPHKHSLIQISDFKLGAKVGSESRRVKLKEERRETERDGKTEVNS